MPGQVATFLTVHLGQPVASPAPFERNGTRFRRAVDGFAREIGIPVVRFTKGDRKVDVVRPYLERAAAAGGSRVAAIGVAQEFRRVTSASRRPGGGDIPRFSFGTAERPAMRSGPWVTAIPVINPPRFRVWSRA
jgi:hypothetical protein